MVILVAISLLGMICTAYLVIVNRQMEKMLSDSQARCHFLIQQMTDVINENSQCHNRVILKTTAIMILTMRIYALQNEEEPYSMCRNRLHFWGIPFDILDDPERLYDFFDKCLDDSMEVGDGTPPYTFSFNSSVSSQEAGKTINNSKKRKQNEK